MTLDAHNSDELQDEAVDFLKEYFGEECDALTAVESDDAIIEEILKSVNDRFSTMKYILGLAIDFTVLAQNLSAHDPEAKKARPDLTDEGLFERYDLVTHVGTKAANTLSLKYKTSRSEGIRKVEEKVVSLFHTLDYTGYPSAYVYNTGQWKKFRRLLVSCFKLSEGGRYKLCCRLINLCCSLLPKNAYFGRPEPRVNLFDLIINEYPRTDSNENGGLAFQSLAYGFVAADRNHLELIASGVRTGSARQKRIGDIDCYAGLDLELSVEVKDLGILESNYAKQLSGFVKNVTKARVLGMVVAKNYDKSSEDELVNNRVIALSEAKLRETVSTWDWPKQNQAVLAMLHFLSHIEQNPHAVQRLLGYIHEHDPSHDALVYLQDTN